MDLIDNGMDIEKILHSGGVTRFHAVPDLTSQRIDSHQWGVAMLCQYFDPDCRKEVLVKALTHDCAELYTGDIPSTCKWKMAFDTREDLSNLEKLFEAVLGVNYALTEEEENLLKICDSFEGMLYCVKRRKSGEIAAEQIFKNWLGFVNSQLSLNEIQTKFLMELNKEMEKFS